VIDHFHFVIGEVVHCSDGSEQVEAELIADGGGDFHQAVFSTMKPL
jgi:hypothetical protein